MPSFKENRLKCCRKRKPALNLLNLPNEMLTEIFSYLKKKEIMKIIRVCKKLNSISKTPSLWKSTGVNLRNKKQVVSFCLFFKEVSIVQKLLFIRSIRFRVNLDREVKYVKPLFKSLKNLRCLQTNFPLIQEMLPSTLLHLSFQSQRAVVVPQLTEFPNSPYPMLQFLRLYLSTDIPSCIEIQQLINNLVGVLINNTLEFLTVHMTTFNKDVLLMIGNCYNLKDVRLTKFDKRSPKLNLNLMNIFSNLPNLEILALKGFHQTDLQLSNLRRNSFQKLKYLNIGTDKMSLRDYDAIRKCIRNLTTFLVNFYTNNTVQTIFLDFITNYKTLENVGISAIIPHEVAEVLLDKIIELHEKRHFKSVCLCGLCFLDYSLRLRFEEKVRCSKCVLLSFDINVCPCCDRSIFES